ncbi:PQQ-binding-like beta-propeller repeat protein [Streptomyces sp. NBC_00503]|uniref:PQQ-binding-like beta-propeller repeat protein n=1 Tax=Streptomyces sp. NBC_00503 TaxID=2903659 RepID=UPI002E7FB4F0|nr:PQQ-binding-like beta-propeller repeat protein [Streptomyces sp. NBC_00503]WUD79962.1 hypothetical protein OG490_04940 [Streptomyces sp. NBC_00503]
MAQAWKTPPVKGDTLLVELLGNWNTDTAYYIGRRTGVEIYDSKTGNRLGTVTPPEPDMHPCAMTEGLSKGGLGAIGWVKGNQTASTASCDQVSLIDTRKGGAVRWTTQVAGVPVDGKAVTDESAALAFVEGDVLAVMTPNTVVALRPDKKVAWTWVSPRAGLHVRNTAMTARGDRITVMMGVETQGTADWTWSVSTLDAAKGRQMDATAVPMTPPKDGFVRLVGNGAPAALLLPDGLAANPPPPELVTFGRDGGVARRIPLATTVGPVLLHPMELANRTTRFDIAFDADATTAYVIAGETTSLTVPASVVAYDLATGTQMWSKPVGTATVPRFLGTGKDAVYVLGGKAVSDMSIQSYAAKDGTPAKIGTVTAPDIAFPVSSLVVDYRKGNLVMVETGVSPFYGAIAFRASGG